MGLFKSREIERTDNAPTPVFYPIEVKMLCLAPYQRNVSMNRVKYYADHYDPCIFGVILVNHRDGRYYILDGMHRVEVAKMLKIPSVLCQVLEGLTYEEECKKFLKLNSERKELNANQSFKARVESGETFANNIVEILDRYGFAFNPNCGIREDNIVGAIRTVERIARRNGLGALDHVLDVIRNAWYGSAASFDVSIMRGLNTFLLEYPEVDMTRLIKTLEKVPPENIKMKAIYNINVDNLAGLNGGNGKKEHIAKTIRDLYNKSVPRQERLV